MGQDQLSEPAAFPGNIPSRRHQREKGMGQGRSCTAGSEPSGTTWKNHPGNDPALSPPLLPEVCAADVFQLGILEEEHWFLGGGSIN